MREKDIKRFYRLNWEYLRRSKDYKEYCEIVRNTSKEKISLPPSSGYWPNNPKFNKRESLKYQIQLEEGECWPTKEHIIATFFHFGDIQAFSFPKWWKWKKKNLAHLESIRNHLMVRTFSDSFKRYFKLYMRSYQLLNDGEEPSLEVFVSGFPIWLNNLSSELSLTINLEYGKTEEIIRKVNEIVVPKKRQISNEIKIISFVDDCLRNSRSHIKFDELERYLKVYDLYNQKPRPSWREIINQVQPNAKGNFENIKRAFQMDFKKAKKLIKNAEYNLFPGTYDKTSERRKKNNDLKNNACLF